MQPRNNQVIMRPRNNPQTKTIDGLGRERCVESESAQFLWRSRWIR